MQPPARQGQNRLRQSFGALAQRRWTVLLITAATVGGAAAIVFTADRAYTATAEVLVKSTIVESGRDEEVNLETERRVATSTEVAARVAEELGIETEEAEDNLAASNVPGTEILQLSYGEDDADEAQRGAEAFANAYLDNRLEQATAEVDAVAAGLEDQLDALVRDLAVANQQARTAPTPVERTIAGTEADAIVAQIAALRSDLGSVTAPSRIEVGRVVQPPELPENPAGAGAVPTLVLALLLGLAIGIGTALFRDRLDQRMRDRISVEATTGAPVLGAVPPLARRHRRRGSAPVTLAEPDGPHAEAYRIARARLAPSMDDGRLRTILVTSPRSGEGKSATAANLGVVFSQADKRTVVVGTDMRRPSLHALFNASRDPGLSTALSSDAPPHLNTVPTGTPNLVLLPSGVPPANPAELLASGAMTDALQRLRQTADVVILDSPPLLSVADATTLAGLADGVVLVADARTTTQADLSDAVTVLRQVKANVLGSVLVNFEPGRASYYAPEPATS